MPLPAVRHVAPTTHPRPRPEPRHFGRLSGLGRIRQSFSMNDPLHLDAIRYDGALASSDVKADQLAETGRHHVIIAGTGRAGTSFLVQLLTRLGLPTGFDEGSLMLYEEARAGLEWRLDDPASPYIVKSPYIGRDLRALIERREVIIDQAYVPIRDIEAAASSRAHVQRMSTGRPDKEGQETAGGLWMVDRAQDQPKALAWHLAGLFESLACHDVPVELIWFPRLTRDPPYLYRKLAFLVRDLPYERFFNTFCRTVKPGWVSQFTPGDA